MRRSRRVRPQARRTGPFHPPPVNCCTQGMGKGGVRAPYTYMYMYVYTCICICIYAYKSVYISISISVSVLICIYLSIHTYIYTHTHIYICISVYIPRPQHPSTTERETGRVVCDLEHGVRVHFILLVQTVNGAQKRFKVLCSY